MTIFVGRERSSGLTMATTVPMKASTGKFTLDKILEFIDEAGDTNQSIIIKTDYEPSIGYLVKDSIREREDGKTT